MRFLLVIILINIFFVSNSFALKDGKTLYKKCRGCHGINGKHIPFERINGVIGGRDKVELEMIINSIRDGNYKEHKINNIMQKVVKKFTNEEVVIISEYISRF